MATSRVCVTGSSTGLGLTASQLLVEQGHRVVVHGRDQARADEAVAACPGAEAVVLGDLASLAGCRSVAEQANRLGRFDAVIHNAGIGYRGRRRSETVDGLPEIFAVNVLAPYVLTALIHRPARLVYLGSGLHQDAEANLDDLAWKRRAWDSLAAYSESKLHDVLLAFAIARRWPGVTSNAVDPGWVATRMGGPGAPDDMDDGRRTQVWLAAGEDPGARVTGEYLWHMELQAPNPQSRDTALQDQLLEACASLSGIPLPG